MIHHHPVNVAKSVLMENVAKNAPAQFHVPRDISAKEELVYQGVSEILTVQIRSFAWPESVKILVC